MNKKLSQIVSLIFNPLFMPLYMALIIVYSHPQQFTDTSVIHNDVRLIYFSAIMVFFPLISLFMMKRLQILNSWQLTNPKERFIPLIAVATFWLWGYYMFKEDTPFKTSSYHVLGDMILGCIVAVFIIFPTNFSVKINFHAVSVGALLSLVVNIINTSQYNLTLVLIATILLSGIILSAQMVLNKLSKNTLLFSFLIGFFGQFFAFQVLSKFM